MGATPFKFRKIEPLFGVNIHKPVCTCPHPVDDLRENEYCPKCHRIRNQDERHKSLQRDPRVDPKPDPPKKYAPDLPGGTGSVKAKSEWHLPGIPGHVMAWTKSEARAMFKQKLGVERLPVGSKVMKIK